MICCFYFVEMVVEWGMCDHYSIEPLAEYVDLVRACACA